MAVEVVGDGKGEERTYAQGDRTQDFVADVEIVVGVTRALPGENAVVGIVDRESGNRGTERGAQFHALEDEIDAELMATVHPLQMRVDVVFLADSFLGPLQGNLLFLGEGLYPAVVIIGTLAQDLFVDGLDLVDVAEEMDDVLRASEQGQMAQDDHAVETVIYQGQQAAKQLCEGLHRFRPLTLALTTRSSDKEPMEIKISNMFG